MKLMMVKEVLGCKMVLFGLFLGVREIMVVRVSVLYLTFCLLLSELYRK